MQTTTDATRVGPARIRMLTALLCSALLAACAAQPTRVATPAAEDAGPAFDPACMNETDKAALSSPKPFPSDEACGCIAADRRILPIVSKLMMNPADLDPILLVVADPPYKTDRRALELNLQFRKQCHSLRLAALASANPKLAGIYRDRYSQYEAVYAELAVKGTALTYGIANQRLRKAYVESEALRTGKPAAKPKP